MSLSGSEAENSKPAGKWYSYQKRLSRLLGYILLIGFIGYLLKDQLKEFYDLCLAMWVEGGINDKVQFLKSYAPVILLPVVALLITFLKKRGFFYFAALSLLAVGGYFLAGSALRYLWNNELLNWYDSLHIKWAKSSIDEKILFIETYVPVVAAPLLSLLIMFVERKNFIHFIFLTLLFLGGMGLLASIQQNGFTAEVFSGWKMFIETYVGLYMIGGTIGGTFIAIIIVLVMSLYRVFQ
jgi:hypothetical protein